jgi:membrane-bound serine protease (ClpP class)
VLLFVAGLILMVVELFVPGWGIFGILGLISLGSAVVLAAYDPAFGIVSLLVALAITLVGVWIAVKVFGMKGVWAKMILKESQKNESGYTSSRDWKDLVGKKGMTLTPLRPAGWVEVDGEKYDVVSEGGMIPAKTAVKVIHVEGSRIVVRRIDTTEEKTSEEEM